jgi:hypothetical protein
MVIYNKTLSNRYKVVINSLALRKREGLARGCTLKRYNQPRNSTIFNRMKFFQS